jgi:Leucine-rich repeat (LRR) protein
MRGRDELVSEALQLQAGGTLNPRRHVYIERPEDAEAVRLLIAGEYVNILSSRQMGKSSLMVRIVGELKARGVRVATVDLAGEIGAPSDAGSFYLSLLRCIVRELDLGVEVDDWWQNRSSDTVNRCFIDFFQTVALAQIEAPIIVFFDEIDSTLRLRYTDDLFTAIRGMYNQRATSAIFERLTFCLLGVATPNELIKDRRTTPYNIGVTIELRDFDADRDDLRALAERLNPDPAIGPDLLERVLYWTDGQPYLTVKLCSELAAAKTRDAVDRYVEDAFTNLDQLSGDPHFQQILRFFETRLTDGLKALKIYTRIAGGRREPDQQTMAHTELKLSGVVKRDDAGCLVVRNEIYRRLFDTKWTSAATPAPVEAWYRMMAIAASVTLVAVTLGGGGYYFFHVRPALQARDELLALRVDVSSADVGRGLEAKLPTGLSQKDFEKILVDLRKVGQVAKLSLERATVTDIAPLARLTALESLDLSQTPVADIAPLASLTALKSLRLEGTKIANIAPLAGLTALESLDLGGTLVADIAGLVGLTTLRSLDLSRTEVVDIRPLARLTRLQILNLGETRVADMAPLAGLTALQTLAIYHTRVTDIAPLAGLTALQELFLPQTKVANIAPLAHLPVLRTLFLHQTQVTDITALAHLTSLQSLVLWGTGVAEVAPLAGLTALYRLDLHQTRVADIAPLAGLPMLQSLDLSGTEVANIAPLARLTALQTLNLLQTDVVDIAPLAGLTDLQTLNLLGTEVDSIVSLADLTTLQTLNLSQTKVADIAPLAGLTAL